MNKDTFPIPSFFFIKIVYTGDTKEKRRIGFMQSNIYGYVRVSTKEQCEDRQLIALRAFPVEKKNIFMDKLSGKDFNRPKYRMLIRQLRAGDILVFCCRPCIADFIICSSDRTGKYQTETKGGDCCGKAAGSTFWTSQEKCAGGVLEFKVLLGKTDNLIAGGG